MKRLSSLLALTTLFALSGFAIAQDAEDNWWEDDSDSYSDDTELDYGYYDDYDEYGYHYESDNYGYYDTNYDWDADDDWYDDWYGDADDDWDWF